MLRKIEELLFTKYDYKATEIRVLEVFKNFEEARYKFMELQEPKITSNYDIAYEIHGNDISNPTGVHSFALLDTEEKLDKFYSILSGLSNKLHYYEKGYLVCCLINKYADEATADVLGISRPTLNKWGKTCIIKCGIAFGVAVLK